MRRFVQKPSEAEVSPEVWAGGLGARDRVAGLLERSDGLISEIDEVTGDAPQPSLVESLPQEELVRIKFASFLGEVSVKNALKQTPETDGASEQTLAKSIEGAKRGDEEAMRRVEINVATATAEGWFKSGHITKTRKELSPDGQVLQFGLTTETMHRDSIVQRPDRPGELKEFTVAEAMNGFREEELAAEGELQDSWFIAVSLVPEGLPEEQLDHRGDGYFTRSMTYSLQGTTQKGADIITETVFDKGTSAYEKADYQTRQAERFDIKAIGKVYERLGLDAPKTALEMLKTPIKVPKNIMPNGMVDFWRWVDEAKDELRGEAVTRTEQEYLDRVETSKEREKSLSGVQQTIKEELLEMDGTFDTDMEAVDALWELVRKHGPEEAAVNEHIDPMVFGPDAASMVDQARDSIKKGDTKNAKLWAELASGLATVSGCGGGSCGIESLSGAKLQRAREVLKTKPGANVEIVEDTERPCPECNEMTIVYEYVVDTNIPPKKACTNNSCEASENV